MGIGLLFVGYLSFFCFRVIPIEAVGFVFLLKGLCSLKHYNPYFKAAEWVSWVGFVDSLFFAVYFVIRMFGGGGGTTWSIVISGEGYLYHALLIGLHLLLALGLFALCKECGYEKGARRAKQCIALSVVLAVTIVCAAVLPQYGTYLQPAMMLVTLVWLLWHAILIYMCYARIATPEQIEKEDAKIADFHETFGKRRKKGKKGSGDAGGTFRVTGVHRDQ